MAQLDIARSYEEGEVLLEADLDAIRSDITTFFNTTKLNDDNFQTNSIDADLKLIDSTVTTAVLDDEAITGAKIADLAITTAKIGDLAVAAGHVDLLAVTTAKIVDDTLGTTDFAAATVSQSKRTASIQSASSATTLFSSTSTAETDITGGSVAIVGTGKPIFVFCQPASTSTEMGLQVGSDLGSSAAAFRLYRKLDAGAYSCVAAFTMAMRIGRIPASTFLDFAFEEYQWPSNGIQFYDSGPAASAGTYTYKLTVQSGGSGTETEVHSLKLAGYEIV